MASNGNAAAAAAQPNEDTNAKLLKYSVDEMREILAELMPMLSLHQGYDEIAIPIIVQLAYKQAKAKPKEQRNEYEAAFIEAYEQTFKGAQFMTANTKYFDDKTSEQKKKTRVAAADYWIQHYGFLSALSSNHLLPSIKKRNVHAFALLWCHALTERIKLMNEPQGPMQQKAQRLLVRAAALAMALQVLMSNGRNDDQVAEAKALQPIWEKCKVAVTLYANANKDEGDNLGLYRDRTYAGFMHNTFNPMGMRWQTAARATAGGAFEKAAGVARRLLPWGKKPASAQPSANAQPSASRSSSS